MAVEAMKFSKGLVLPALVCYFLAAECVVVGLNFGAGMGGRRRSPPRVASSPNPVWNCLTQWDGQWYLRILDEGYRFDPGEMSSVAFFPLFPLLGRAVRWMTGWSSHASLWITAHASLLASLALFCRYVRKRPPPHHCFTRDSQSAGQFPPALCALAALALYPPGFFLWMAYSEPLFLLLSLGALYGIHRGWRPVWVAAVVGLATAARPVGVALMVPFALYAWRWHVRRPAGVPDCIDVPGRFWGTSAIRASLPVLGMLPLAAGGLLLYMAFQGWEFGAPLAFAQAQSNWEVRQPGSLADRLLRLAVGEPIWSAYIPGSEGHWTRLQQGVPPLMSLHFFDPVVFVAAVALMTVGAVRRWLTQYEVLFGMAVLAIGYVARGYEMTMASQARFTTVVFPIYLVLGLLLARLPWWAVLALLAVFGSYMGIFAAMWAAGYVLI